jgi:hypothetical protein
LDFLDDRLAGKRAYQLHTIVDIYLRECVALEVAPRFCRKDGVPVLRRACAESDALRCLRWDNC